MSCGAPLPEAHGAAADRRQLTVMFCDLVGSTRLSEQLDPEDMRALLLAYQAAAGAVIEHFDGHVAQLLGDGMLVYFGWPQAHEDDPRRAVLAGLGINDAMRELSRRYEAEHGVAVAARVGIHTGPVVTGAMGGGLRREYLATGQTPNLAARIQGIAEPSAVVISDDTYQLVYGFFDCQHLGERNLKGLAAPVAVHRVQGESGVSHRFELSVASGLTPVVGREAELDRLLRHLAEARGGRGHAVLLMGEAGIGKSRLLYQFREKLADEPLLWRVCVCSPYERQSPFHPIIELLRELLSLDEDETTEQKLAKLRQRAGDRAPLLASFLSVPIVDAEVPKLSSQAMKEQIVELLHGMLFKLAEGAPVIVAIEDLHWSDPSTLSLIEILLPRLAAARVLLLLTARPEFVPPWGESPLITVQSLGRLKEASVETMVAAITGGKTLPAEVMEQIVARSDGMPLAAEELTRMVLEEDFLTEEEGSYRLAGPLPPLAIPATLQDSLTARLDRLGEAREVAQLASVVGRRASYELLAAVSHLEDAALRDGLARLVEARLMYQDGVFPEAKLIFKHALIRDAAYQSLLKSDRREIHGHVAAVLVDRFAEQARTAPELVAHHYSEAGMADEAVGHWQRAAQVAASHYAEVEAIEHLRNGLAQIAELPASLDRDRRELELQLALAPRLMATRGWALPEVGETLARARDLCGPDGDTGTRFSILRGLWQFHVVRGELQTARELGQGLLEIAEGGHDRTQFVEACRTVGETALWLGDLDVARDELERGIEEYHAGDHYPAEDPQVMCLCTLAWVQWLRGFPEQALVRAREAASRAEELGEPFSIAVALYYLGVVHACRGESEAVPPLTQRIVALAEKHGFMVMAGVAALPHGRALVGMGRFEEGIEHLKTARVTCVQTGTVLQSTMYLALLADGLSRAGRHDEALAILAKARDIERVTRERFWSPELRRLEGEILLRRSDEGARPAEVCFEAALEAAREIGAKSWELRAATSLARLWREQGRGDAARAMLEEQLGRFSEGRTTADQRAARALLAELAGAPSPGSIPVTVESGA